MTSCVCVLAGANAPTAANTDHDQTNGTPDDLPSSGLKTETATTATADMNGGGGTNGEQAPANGYADNDADIKPNIVDKPADAQSDATQSGASTPTSTTSIKTRKLSVRAKKLSSEDVALLSKQVK